jgi:hypothetical protein
MSDNQTLIIRFENETAASASQKAYELREKLLDISPDVSAEITKDDQSTQDFGATLVLVLGTPVLVIVAKGISDYLTRTGGSITIEEREGKITKIKAENVKSNDVARIIEAFSKRI